MPSRKPTRAPMTSNRKQTGRPHGRTAKAATSTGRPKRKIGRKLLLLALLIWAGHFGYTHLIADKPVAEGVSADSSKAAQAEAIQLGSKAEAEPKLGTTDVDTTTKLSLLDRIDTEKWFGWAQDWAEKVFVVRNVQLAGALSVSRDSLLAITDSLMGTPMFDLQLFDLAHEMSTHPRIGRARISRRLPSTLLVTILERREEMLVVTHDGLQGVDGDNIVLPPPPPGWPLDVPLVTGFEGTLAVGDTVKDERLLEAADWVRRAQRSPRVLGWISEVRVGLLGVDWICGINGWRVDPGGHAVVAQVAAIDAYLEENDEQRTQVDEVRRLDLRFPGFLIVKHGI
ncbi:FtsQ-type POTRA domain-containing protein [bacterium]|nr:FtsQ-type POTRA domain-containing protein [bacterium]